ncbi:MAG: septum formation initiator family protein [Caldibacillus sp.]
MSQNRSRIPVLNNEYMKLQERERMIQERRKKGLRRRLAVFFIFAAIVSFTFIKAIQAQESMLAEKMEQLERLEKTSKQLKEKEKYLEEEIIKLQDEEYLGKYVRKELLLSEDGEIIFTVPEDEE